MGAGGSSRISQPRVASPAPTLPRIEVKVVATARFADGSAIEIESLSVEEAYDAIWQALCREAGRDAANAAF